MSGGASARMTAAAVAAAMFMSQLDGTVIHTALPAMGRSFGVAPVDLSIGVTIYLLAQAVFLPASAWLADRLQEFVDLNPDFEIPIERLATWLARLDDEDD